MPDSEFDSWLTIGIIDGDNKLGTTPDINLQEWKSDSDFQNNNAAVFYMNPESSRTLPSTLVVAQLTIPIDLKSQVKMGVQGFDENGKTIYQYMKWDILPLPSQSNQLSVEEITPTTLNDSFKTYRVKFKLSENQRNIYAIAGTTDSPLFFPPASQIGAPFGTDIGGVNPQFFPIIPDSEFDSWLTIGITNGSSSGIISLTPGFDLSSWSETNSLETNDGAIYYMIPEKGPSERDDGIVIAQLTIKDDLDAEKKKITFLAQGKSNEGDDWMKKMWLSLP